MVEKKKKRENALMKTEITESVLRGMKRKTVDEMRAGGELQKS